MTTPVEEANAEISSEARTPRLRLQGISKHFGGVRALQEVSFDIWPGEVMGIVGDNGAGKSTLIKILSGVHRPSAGELYLDGQAVRFQSPSDARQAGIETVYQDLALVEIFDVAANFFLGREVTKGGWLKPFRILDRAAMRRRAERAVNDLHVRIPRISNELRQMSGGQRQGVAIARAAFWEGKVLLLDEPTAALGVEESGEAMGLIRRLAGNGVSIVMISHNMEHVWSTCDRVTVLRQGAQIATVSKSETTPAEIVGFITGAHLALGAVEII